MEIMWYEVYRAVKVKPIQSYQMLARKIGRAILPYLSYWLSEFLNFLPSWALGHIKLGPHQTSW